jgi:hypothetical protein
LSIVSSPVHLHGKDEKTSTYGHASRAEALQKMGARGWAEASNAGRRFPPDGDPGMMKWFVDEMGKSDVDVLIAMYTWASSFNTMPYLPKIKAPVLGLYPTDGPISGDEQIALLKANVPHARIVRLPTRYHSPREVRAAFDPFFRTRRVESLGLLVPPPGSQLPEGVVEVLEAIFQKSPCEAFELPRLDFASPPWQLGAGAASAQNYPTKPIRLLASGVGGGGDFTARLIAVGPTRSPGPAGHRRQPSGRAYSGRNRRQAQPDGHTVYAGGNCDLALPFMRDTMPFDPVRKDFSARHARGDDA